jgi:NTE family protein
VLGPDVRRDAALDALEDAEPPPGAVEGELEPRAYVVDAGGRSVPRLLADHTGFGHAVVLMREGGLPPNHVDRTVRLVDAHEGGGGADADYAVRAFVDAAVARRANRHRDGAVDVPPLEPADETALRNGLLPASTPAGTALGSVARDAADIEVGVALGGGAIRGWAHIGVLDAFAKAGVPVDYVAGTSIGAIVASVYCAGMTIEEITEALYRTSARIFKVTVPRNALLSPSGLRAGLQQTLRETLIEDLAIPCAVTATDILAQREVVLRSGLLWEAVLASVSIPGVWPPHRIGPYLLVDGGVLNPVPSNVVADMGASIQIGIKLTRSMTRSKARGDRAPRLIDMITSTFELMQSKISTDTAAASTLLIEPTFDDSAGFGLRGFHEGRRYIPNGEEAVEAALPRIAAVLPWLRRREAAVAH